MDIKEFRIQCGLIGLDFQPKELKDSSVDSFALERKISILKSFNEFLENNPYSKIENLELKRRCIAKATQIMSIFNSVLIAIGFICTLGLFSYINSSYDCQNEKEKGSVLIGFLVIPFIVQIVNTVLINCNNSCIHKGVVSIEPELLLVLKTLSKDYFNHLNINKTHQNTPQQIVKITHQMHLALYQVNNPGNGSDADDEDE